MSVTALRADIYKTLDRVAATGEPVEIERNGVRLKITRVTPDGKLARLRPRPDVIVGDPEELVSVDWSEEWNPSI